MIKAIFKSILFVFALLMIMIYLVFFTETGFKLTYYAAKPHLPGKLNILSIKGKWIGPIILEDITYTQPDAFDLHIDAIKLSWDLSQLIKQKLVVHDVVLNNILIKEQANLTTRKKTDAIIGFPLYIQNADIHQLTFESPRFASPLTFRYIHSHGFVNKNVISVLSNWQDASIGFTKTWGLKSVWGNLKISGPVTDYNVTGQFLLSSQQLPPSEWQLTAEGDLLNKFNFVLQGQLLTGHLDITGQTTWYDSFTWNTYLQGTQLQLAKANQLNFKAHYQGNLNGDDLAMSLAIQELTGKMDKENVHAQGALQLKNKELFFDNLKLYLGKAKLLVDGVVGAEWRLQWDIDIPRFQTYLPITATDVKSQGSVTGSKSAPLIQADFSLTDLQYQDLFIKSLSGITHLNANQKFSTLNVTGHDLLIGNLPIEQVSVIAKGTAHQHYIESHFQMVNEHINLKLQGELADKKWQGLLTKLEIERINNSLWQLEQAAKLNASLEEVLLSNFCLRAKQGKLCGNIHWIKKLLFNLALQAVNVDAALITNLLTDELTLTNQINGTLVIHQTEHSPVTGQLNLTLSPGEVRFDSAGLLHRYQISRGNLTAELSPQGLQGNAKMSVLDRTPLTLDFALPAFHQKWFNQEQPIASHLKMNFIDLSLLSLVSPHIHNIKGSLVANAAITGSIKNPQINANLNLQNGSFTLPNLGLTIKNIHIVGKNSGYQSISYEAQALSGQGDIAVKGITYLNQTGFPTELLINGTNVEIVNTPEVNVSVMPTIKIMSKGNDFNITGKVVVPKALIKPQDFSTTVTLSDDVVFINQGKPRENNQFNVKTNIDVFLGENVLFDFSGLTGNLKGEVTLKDSSDQGTAAFGQFSIVNGKLNKFNQELSIQQGQLLFTGGAVDNPGINLKASKRIVAYQKASGNKGPSIGVSQFNVGLQILGNINEPRITLFSEPKGLSQSEILSYLVLSTPLAQAEGGENQLLFQALQGLNLTTGQTGMIQEQIQQKLGLDQLSVSSGEVYNPETESLVQNTSLILGKMLSPKLLLSYSIGLIEPINILKLSYKLSDKFTLQTEASTESSGIDIFYSIERD